MFRTLIYPSSGACDCVVELPHGRVVLGSLCIGVLVWLVWSGCRLKPATRIPPQLSHTETPTHNEPRTHDQCDDSLVMSQAPDDGCINVRNMLNIEEVK